MKKTALMMLASLTLNLNAEAAGVKYICKEIADYDRQTLVLTQVGDREIKEGVKERFVLEVFQGNSKVPRLVKKGTVETEDVMFGFKSDDKKVSAMIYLDEMDQTSLDEGRKETRFDCH